MVMSCIGFKASGTDLGTFTRPGGSRSHFCHCLDSLSKNSSHLHFRSHAFRCRCFPCSVVGAIRPIGSKVLATLPRMPLCIAVVLSGEIITWIVSASLSHFNPSGFVPQPLLGKRGILINVRLPVLFQLLDNSTVIYEDRMKLPSICRPKVLSSHALPVLRFSQSPSRPHTTSSFSISAAC